MRIKLLTLFVILIATLQITLAGPFNAKKKKKRIPAGTKLEMKLLTPLSTSAGAEGMSFSAMLITDQTSDNDVILPMASVVRGTITKIIPAKRMSKGSIIYMDFDHVVTPNGRQLPLSLNITGRSDLTYDGGITTTRGYGDAFKQTCQKSGEIARESTQWGFDVGEDYWNGYMQIITVPVGIIGAGLGTAGYFVYDSIADMIRKGKDVELNKGEIFSVILTDPIDVPVI